MRVKIPGERHPAASFRFVLGLFCVLALAFVAGQWATFSSIRDERERQLDHLCAEVETVRTSIRDFLQNETQVSDKMISRYFERVDCDL